MTQAPMTEGPITRRRGRRRRIEIRPGSVKEARQRAGLSLRQIARSDITRTAIYSVETVKAKPSQETLERSAHATGHTMYVVLRRVTNTELHPTAPTAKHEPPLAT